MTRPRLELSVVAVMNEHLARPAGAAGLLVLVLRPAGCCSRNPLFLSNILRCRLPAGAAPASGDGDP